MAIRGTNEADLDLCEAIPGFCEATPGFCEATGGANEATTRANEATREGELPSASVASQLAERMCQSPVRMGAPPSLRRASLEGDRRGALQARGVHVQRAGTALHGWSVAKGRMRGSITMIYTLVLNRGDRGVQSPVD